MFGGVNENSQEIMDHSCNCEEGLKYTIDIFGVDSWKNNYDLIVCCKNKKNKETEGSKHKYEQVGR